MQRGANVLPLRCRIKIHCELSILSYSTAFFWVKLFLKMLKCVDSKNPYLISVLATVSLLPLHELFRR